MMEFKPRHRIVASADQHWLPRRIAIWLLLLAWSTPGPGIAAGADPAMTIGFLYNIARFTDWPAGSRESQLTLCMMGDTEALSQGLTGFEGRTLSGREWKVRHMSRLGELNGCNILFIAKSEERYLAGILPGAHARNVLTVSDIDAFAELGGIVGLSGNDDKIEFDINTAAARHAGLRISSQVLKLARSILGR